MLLPTPATISFAAAWSAAAPGMLAENLSEQGSLVALEGMHFESCSTLCKCYSAAHNVRPAWRLGLPGACPAAARLLSCPCPGALLAAPDLP